MRCLGQTYNQPNSTEQELERLREELRVQKELNEKQASNKSCVGNQDIVDKIEYLMENDLQCGICSELMVFVSWSVILKFYFFIFLSFYLLKATSLNCMHTFCQYCIGEWKKNKVTGSLF